MAFRRRTLHSEKKKRTLLQETSLVTKEVCLSPKAKMFKFSSQASIEVDLKMLFTQVKEKARPHLNEITDTDLLLTSIVATLGFNVFQSLLSAIHHVPEVFPNASSIVAQIVNVDQHHLDESDIKLYTQLINKLPVSTDYAEVSDTVLWRCQFRYKEPFHHFLVPPVTTCLHCNDTLYSFHVTNITVFTLQGPLPARKLTLRCKKGCGATYSIDTYNSGSVTRFYDCTTPWVNASNRIYLSSVVHELMCESGNHAFVSHHAFSEIYTAVFNSTPNGVQYAEWIKEVNVTDNEHDELDTEDCDPPTEEAITEKGYQRSMSRKNAMNAYLNGELANELRQRNLTSTQGMTNKKSRETVMSEIDRLRRLEHYPHNASKCTDECKEKGCENLRVIDSCWKVCMPHCMFAMEMEVQGFPLLNFPNVCTLEPKPGSVFCHDHHKMLEDKNIPTKKEDFLQFIGCKKNPSSTDDIKMVDEKIQSFSKQLANDKGVTALKYQNTEEIVTKLHPSDWEPGSSVPSCNKDTGEKARLRQRSRGHFISVTGGGHIQYFEPIFKSEGPCQVFMITIRSLLLELSSVPADKIEQHIDQLILAYDNMCHLDCIKAAKEDLPFPAPLNTMWKRIKKVVDRLHLQNHKDELCKERYNPATIPESYNTMIAEQTFSWFSRFKKIANSMTQTHHLFYIHRQIQRRNKYTETCRSRGKEPLLPGINQKLKSKQ